MSFRSKQGKESKEAPRISDAEWTVMKVVWREQPATARQVVDALKDQAEWKPKTIHTLLSRLVQKGAVKCDKAGREHLFRSAATEQECRLAASCSFLDKVFDGEIAPFLACFVQRERLSRKEIDELKHILEGKEP
jgi:BlaI family penicillinase repressor